MFYGKFRSVTTCPLCKHVSLKFEAFSMLSLPINKKTGSVVSVSFYILTEFNLSNITNAQAKIVKSDTIKDLRFKYVDFKKLNGDDFRFYWFDPEKRTMTPILSDHTITIESVMLLKETMHLFLIQDRVEDLSGSFVSRPVTPTTPSRATLDRVTVNIMLEGIDVKGFTKPVQVAPKLPVYKMYKFIYQCLYKSTKVLNSFEQDFSCNPEQYPFEISLASKINGAKSLLVLKRIADDSLVSFSEGDIIHIKLLLADLKRSKELQGLSAAGDEALPGAHTLIDCLDALLNPEQLDEKNQWLCDKCKERSKASFQLKIKELPPILIIHLKRFKSLPGQPTTKLEDTVDYPFADLNMARYTADPSLPINKQKYTLFAMINHSGKANFGHYTSILHSRLLDGWFLCDDDSVTSVRHAHKDASYILFYRREASS